MDCLSESILKIGLLGAQSLGEETTQILGMIQRFLEALHRKEGFDQSCEDFLRIIIEETRFENCSILLWNDKRKALSFAAAYGLEDLLEGEQRKKYNKNLFFASGEGIAGRVFASRVPAYVENVMSCPIPLVSDSVVEPRSLACIPMLHLGVLCVSGFQPQTYTARLRRNLEILGSILGYLLLGAYPEEFSEGVCREAAAPPAGPCETEPQAPHPLSALELLSEQALDRIPQGLCLLDSEGKVMRINQSIRKMGGRSASDIAGRSPSVLFRQPEVFEKLFCSLDKSNEGELSEVQLVNHAGEICLADVHLLKLSDDFTRPTGYLLVINDVTQKKACVEKELRREKLAALGTMAGGVSHDFNNLLMAILGHVQLLLHEVTDEEVRRRLLNLEKAVHDGSHTVRRLQKFTERDSTSATVSVDVREAILDVVELTRPRWKNTMEKGGHAVEFRMELEPRCMAAIHASDLREVLTNLIFNAVEAMPEGGTISLKCRTSGPWAFIDVSDTGIGMTRDVAAKIFDPFYTTKGVGNSGMGLSVSWSLVERYGGEIQVTSKPGKGTAFLIRFPLAERDASKGSFQNPEGESKTCRLLVVDDDGEILGILRDMLRLKGHKVTAVSDARKALDLIESCSYDLILTDLGMPSVSGWEIARRAKAKDPRTPVVLITGWGVQYEHEDLSARGVDLVLCKPLSWDKLLAGLEKMFALQKGGQDPDDG